MINYLNQTHQSESFVHYLNVLVNDHYSILYPRRRTSPLDDTLFEINAALGAIAFACACGNPYPKGELSRCSVEAIRNLPPMETIFKEWEHRSVEGVVIGYCEWIDRSVIEAARRKEPNAIHINCPLFLRRAEITERLFQEMKSFNDTKKS